MNKIETLKKQLAEAQAELENDAMQKRLDDAKKQFEGCWSTHKICRFKYPGKGFEFSLDKHYDFEISSDKKDINCKTISIRAYTSNNNFSFTISDYGYLNVVGTYFHDGCKYRISEKSFNELRTKFQAYLEAGIDSIRMEIPSQPEVVTMGDHGLDCGAVAKILESKIPVINTTEYQGVGYISLKGLISSYNHPLLIGEYLVNNQYSKSILENIIKRVEDNMYSWGGSILERDIPRVKALKSFLDSVQWQS